MSTWADAHPWAKDLPSAKDVKSLRLQVPIGPYLVCYHDDSNGNHYYYISNGTGESVKERGIDYWTKYQDVLLAAHRLAEGLS